jgi:curli biogenesis system outer membrane secretion channel CsgG
MKRLFACAFVLALASIPAFAAKNSQSVTVPEAVSVGSTQLPAGQYKVTWTGSGSSVQVTFKQQDVRTPATATVQAKLVSQNHDHAAVTINSQGGVNSIEQIQLNHVSLLLGSGPAPGQ